MGLLRAAVREQPDWWELMLLDLKIAADGVDEAAMIADLERTLIAEYHLALKFGATPFLHLLRPECPDEVRRSWESKDMSFRKLKLPPEVSAAIAAVFRWPRHNDMGVGTNAA